MNMDRNQKKFYRTFFDGCFDLAHYGHSNGLRQTRLRGKFCIVHTHSDDIIDHYKKTKPVFSQDERKLIVLSYRWVHEFHITNNWNITKELLDELNSDVSMHGEDSSPGDTDGSGDAYSGVKNAGRFEYIKRTDGISTTDLIGRILSEESPAHQCEQFSPEQLILLEHLRSSSDGHRGYIGVDIWDYIYKTPLPWLPGKLKPTGRNIIYLQSTFDLLNVGDIEFITKSIENKEDYYLIIGVEMKPLSSEDEVITTLPERVLNVVGLKYLSQLIINVPKIINEELVKFYNIQEICIRCLASDHPTNAKDCAGAQTRHIRTESQVTAATIMSRVRDNREYFQAKLE